MLKRNTAIYLPPKKRNLTPDLSFRSNSFFIHLFGSENAVARIAEARDDVPVIIELLVKGAYDDVYVRMGILQCLEALRCGYDTKETDVIAPVLFESVDGVDGGAACRAHRVDDEYVTFVDVGRKLAVVLDRLESRRIAVHADMSDLGARDQLLKAFDHAEARAKDRDDRQLFACQALSGRLADRGLDIDILENQVSRRFIAFKHCNLGNDRSEITGSGLFVADKTDFMLDQRVIHNGNFAHNRILLRFLFDAYSVRLASILICYSNTSPVKFKVADEEKPIL